MKSFRFPTMIVIFLIGSIAFARSWTPDDDAILGIPVPGAVQIQSQTLEIGHLNIHIGNPAVKMQQLELNKRAWTLVTIEGETRLWQPGKPALPLISRVIRLPNTGNVQLKVTPGEFVEYTNIDVLPQQPTELKKVDDHFEPADYAFDNELYSSNEWYPKELAGLTPPEIIRDARTALLGVSPVQYNPVTRTLRVYQSIDIETTPIGGESTNEIYDTRSHSAPSFASIYDDIIGAEDLFDDARNAPPGGILFICRPNLQTQLQPLADWKTQSGRPTRIVTTNFTTAQLIKDSIIMPIYNSSAPPLETVMLVGDGGTTGDYYLPSFSSISYTDHVYGVIGTGLVASIWVSRLSCNSAAQLQTEINRSIIYERTPNLGTTGSDTTWITTGWGYTRSNGLYDGYESMPTCVHYCLNMMSTRGIRNTFYDEHNSGSVDPILINTRLTNGAAFWVDILGWIGEISPSSIQNILNTNKPYVSCHLAESTGDWYGTSTGMQEADIQLGTPTQPKGAIASIATETSNVNPNHDNLIADGMFYAYGVKYARQAGPMFFEGKFQIWRNYSFGDASNATNFIYWNNPMGDISANLWTGVPQTISINAPPVIGIGQNRLDLRVMRGLSPVSGAMVTAWKKNAGGANETYIRAITDDSGRVELALTNTTTGSMLLTVIGNQPDQNIYPIVDTIQVVQSAFDLALSNISIIDDSANGRSGNNNGVPNPCEVLDIAVQLINRGTTIASSISGVLSSSDPRISIVNAAENWNNDSVGNTVGTITPFRIHLLSGFHDNEIVPLALNVTTAQGNRSFILPLSIRSAHITFVSATTNPTIVNVGGTADVSITVRNIGGLATTNMNATLFSLSPFAIINTDNAVFPALPVGSNVSNPTNQLFRISTNGRTLPGTIVDLGVAFISGAVNDTIYFPLTIGSRTTHDPAGPDPYGYVAYDNTDTAYGLLAPTYNWLEIMPALGGNGTRLPLSDTILRSNSTSRDTSMFIRLPFTVRYYGATYDSATICTNGWLAFGSQPLYNNSMNWHLPAPEGPRNIVAVNWCDQTNSGANEGAYTKSDTANHRFIVTWKTTTMYSPASEEYQLIINDPAYLLTPSGDAVLQFQYKTFHASVYSSGETGVSYATIGIADSSYTRALEYCYWNVYNPGCAAIPIGTPTTGQRTILFTTTRPNTGNLTGTVVRTFDNQPIIGVNILLLNGGRRATTDSNGHYFMNDLQIGSYRVQASASGFNTKIDTMSIRDSLTTILNFSLTAPGLRLTINDTTVRPNDSIVVNLPDTGGVATRHIYIRNTGNGPLTWNTRLLYSGQFDETDTLWSPIVSFNISQIVGDNLISGVEFDGNNFWLTGANNYNLPNHLYKLDHDGHLLHVYNSPDQSGIFGWRDLAWDGRYLYSSFSSYIDRIDTNGSVVRRFATPVNPARAIAIDTASGTIYYCDQASAIYKMRLSDGAALGSLPNTIGGGVYGLAWYPDDSDGRFLYAFVRDSIGHSAGSRIYRIDPVTGSSVSAVHLGLPNENAAGLCVTQRWNPLLWSIGAVLQTANGSRLALYELAFNSSWIFYTPHQDSIQANQMDTVSVVLNGRFLPPYRYRIAIQFSTNSVTPTVIVPVIMNTYRMLGVTDNNPIELPSVYSLKQNYPNPFNPTTTISFTLPRPDMVKLTVYNEIGQVVERVISNQYFDAGYHSIALNSSNWSAGIYFYRFETGNYAATRKMVLMK